MTGVKITVDDAEVIAALRRLIAAGERPDPALKAIGEHMRQSTIDRIVAGKTPAGTPMKPLSPAYAARKKGPGILRETGTLAQIVYQVADGELNVGTNAIYAAIHQFGGSITRHALSRKQSFRVADEGAFTRKDGSRVGSRLRFAQAGSPGSTEKWVTVGEHAIPIPARPFLGISEEDKVAITEILSDFLGQAWGRMEGPRQNRHRARRSDESLRPPRRERRDRQAPFETFERGLAVHYGQRSRVTPSV